MRQNVISVSGGKDSTALLLLAIERETENLSAVFADTGNEHPTTYEFVRYLEAETGVAIRWVRADFTDRINNKAEYIRNHWADDGVADEKIKRALETLKPTGNPFLDLCIWKGRPPSTKARFCTSELKVIPMTEQVLMPLTDAGHEVYSWQGVRRDESRARAELNELDEVGGGLFNFRPILDWTVDDVFAMHKKHGIEPNPLYRQGMGRVGCMPCINCRKDELLEISKRFPEELERIAEWERIILNASKRDGASFFRSKYRGTTIQSAVEWSKTSRGGQELDLFRSFDEPNQCESAYGLCE